MFAHRQRWIYFGFLSLLLFTGVAVLAFVDIIGNFAVGRSLAATTTQPLTDNIYRISMVTNDIVFNPLDGMMYVSRPSSVGNEGNSITRIDPVSGAVGQSVYVGSEPGKLALSDDGTSLYVTLDGAFAIRRYSTLTQTPGLQFSIGREQSSQGPADPYLLTDLAVVPGDPDRVAVARSRPGISPPGAGVAVYHDGVRLPSTGPGHSEGANYLAFGSSPEILYGGGISEGLRTMTVSESGITTVGAPTSFAVRNVKFQNGLLFDSLGHIIDPVQRRLIGTCAVNNPLAFVPDVATGRVLYAVRETPNSNITIKAFDINSFVQIGSLVIPNSLSGGDDRPISLIRYGTNGLALWTRNNEIFLIQTALIPTSDPLPAPSATPLPATPTPTPFAKYIRQVTLPSKDLIYRDADQKFYATVPASAGAPYANSLARIEPSTATIEDSVVVGNQPGRLAFSDDDQTLYIGIDGDFAVRKFNMQPFTPGLQFPLGVGVNGPKTAYDMEVLPGDPNAVAVSYGEQSYNYDGTDIYDEGVKRAQKAITSGSITVASSETLYIGDYDLSKYGVSPIGLTFQQSFATTSYGEVVLEGNLIYTPDGPVVDRTTLDFTGSFTGEHRKDCVNVDVLNNRVYFLISDNGAPPNWSIIAYRLDNFLPIGSVSVPGVLMAEGARRLLRWGENGLAFTDHNKIFFIQTELVSTSGSIPSIIKLGSETFESSEATSNVPITVLRTGGLTETSTVEYTTVDETAIAGVDYTATAGTLTFAPGEASKVVTVPVNNDTIFEGDETFRFVISNPGGTGSVELNEPTTALVTIVENDTIPFASAANISIYEPQGPGMTATAIFTVQLTNPTSQTASLNFGTFDGTATAGLDYVAADGLLTFAPLETTKTISITVLGDNNLNEPSETFRVNLVNGINVGTSFIPATATIINYNPNPTPTPTATPTATPTPSATPTSTPTPNSPTPTATPTLTPTPSPPPTPLFVRKLTLPVNDFVYSDSAGAFYVAVPSSGGLGRGNSITKVDPVNGQIGASVFVGSEPNKMAISDDSNTIYTKLDGAKSFRRFDVASGTAGQQFIPLSPFIFLEDFAVQPGNPNVLAVCNYEGVAIYDNGVQRPNVDDGGAYAITSLAFAGPDILYGFDGASTGYELVRFIVDGEGVTGTTISQTLFNGGLIQYSNGLLYSTTGRVVNPTTLSLVGTFVNGGGLMAIDEPQRRIFFMVGSTLRAFNLDTFQLIGSINIPALSNSAGTLIRWGQNGLAVRDSNDQFYLIQSTFISPNGLVPTAIRLSASSYNRNENGGNLTVTINRSGSLEGTSTVNYHTVDGTATAGSDYIATSGTLTFAPGQLTRTVNVPLIDDNVHEGSEIFGFVLSSPGGDGAVELQDPITAALTITENDPQPFTTTAAIIVDEPRIAGTATALFTIRLTRPTTQTASVNFATGDVSANAGSDYVATSGTVTFAPMETQKTFSVQILADQEYFEANESFRVDFSNGVNVGPGGSIGGTIVNYNPQAVGHVGFDYDSDGKVDISVFRPSTGAWYIQGSTAGYFGVGFGTDEDKIAPADYDGDGKTDIAVYRPSTGIWYVINSASGVVTYNVFGIAEDVPTPADYDGDGKADISVFRPSTGTWYRLNSSNGSFTAIQFGTSGDKPTIGDFDGDRRTDLAVFRPSTGAWYQTHSSNGFIFGEQFGISTDHVCPADYDGDGKTDIAIYRPSEGLWYVKRSATTTYEPYVFGLAADIPTPGDFDGDGKADIGVFRPSDGTWYIVNSSNGGYTIYQFGQNGDRPTPSAFAGQ